MFDEIFNQSGSLYTLPGKNFQENKTGWSAEVVSEQEEYVLHEEHVENVLDKLNELAENKEIKMYRYPNRPEFVPLDNSDLIPKVIDWHHKGFKGVIHNFLKLYPELTDKFYEQFEKNHNERNIKQK